jgi:hypothetical protein
MQISIDSKVLGLLRAHATSAARIVGNRDASVDDDPLSDHIDAIVHELNELLGASCTLIARDAVTSADGMAYDGTRRRTVAWRGEGRVTHRQLPPGKPTFNVANAVNELRQRIAKAEAFATTVDDLFEEVGDHRQHERLAWIVTEAATATQGALAACSKLIDDLAKHGRGAGT